MNLPIRAHGIPALANVTNYIPYTPATWYEPADGPEVEWELLDRRGRPAPWLDRKLTSAERWEIETDLLYQLKLKHYEED